MGVLYMITAVNLFFTPIITVNLATKVMCHKHTIYRSKSLQLDVATLQ